MPEESATEKIAGDQQTRFDLLLRMTNAVKTYQNQKKKKRSKCVKNYLRSASVKLFLYPRKNQPELPFPMKSLQVGDDVCLVYEGIPEEKKQWVLDHVAALSTHRIKVDDWIFDEYQGKRFQGRDCLILRYQGMNIIVSPFFVESGVSFMDFLPWRPGIQKSRIPNIVK